MSLKIETNIVRGVRHYIMFSFIFVETHLQIWDVYELLLHFFFGTFNHLWPT